MIRVPYVQEITDPLVRVLNYARGLPPHKLAAYASNLDFWVSEIRHCMDVIDGYPRRYEQMRRSEQLFFEANKDDWQRRRRMGVSPKPAPRSIKAQELKDLKRSLVQAAYAFVGRCYQEGFLDINGLNRTESVLGLDFRDFKLQ